MMTINQSTARCLRENAASDAFWCSMTRKYEGYTRKYGCKLFPPLQAKKTRLMTDNDTVRPETLGSHKGSNTKAIPRSKAHNRSKAK